MTYERAIIKRGQNLVQAVSTESRSKRKFGSLLSISCMTTGRLATASERTANAAKSRFGILKGHCIEFKYYADGIHSGLTPPG